MSETGFSNDGVPLLNDPSDARSVRRECEASNDPFLAVEERGDEYVVVYDMRTSSFDLSSTAVTVVEDLFDACPETYHRGVGGSPARDPDSYTVEATSGEIEPLDGYTALSLASDLSEIVLDRNNWKAVGDRNVKA